MCGIAGVYNFKSGALASRAALGDMTETIAHRGPDSDGFYLDGPVGLGHRRLSILDLSDRGRQPMLYQGGRYIIVFNGEIYNYLELRENLEKKGYRFETGTDTEVLLALFADRGDECVSQLNGMFAFAIWDSFNRMLFLARDRVGIKPLYYAVTADGIIFGSEVKVLLASGQFAGEVDRSRIDTYFTFGYVPGADTLFQGCKKLLPGSWMRVSSGGIESGKYWDVSYQPNRTRSANQTAAELHELLLDATKIHLRSDVPLGVFLSGGLDSSTTVALLAEAGIRDIQTFSIAYDEGAAYDETRYARLVASRFHTDHHVLYMQPEHFQDFIPGYVWHMDEPVTEAAAISLYFIAKQLRQHVIVALSGEGADELFAGYDIYRYMRWIEHYRRLPESVRLRLLEPVLAALGNDKVQRYLRLARLPMDRRYLGVSLHDAGYKDVLYSDEFKSGLIGTSSDVLADCYSRTRDYDSLSRMLYLDLKTWLVDDLLIKADKMTMANGVESRVPFLDYRVVEYAATIPSNLKLRNGDVKWILKQAMKDSLPADILTRKKVGFPTPLALMFQRNLSSYLRDLLLSRDCLDRGYFKPRAVEKLIDEHVAKQKDHHQVLWKLVVLEEWHRQFIDRKVQSKCHADGN